MTRLIAITIVCALTAGVLVGCGSPKSIAKDTPKATVEAFVEAMKSGDYDAIAVGWEFEIAARSDNSDWDDIPPGQRQQIINILQENKAHEIEAMSGMMTGEATVGDAVVIDKRAVVPVTVGGVTTGFRLAEVDGLWKLLNIAGRARQQ